MAGIKIDITGDNSNFLNAIEGIKSGITQASRVVKQSGDDIDSSQSKAAESVQTLTQKISELNNKLVEDKARVEEQKVTIQQVISDLESAKAAYQTIIDKKGEYAAKTSEEKSELDAVNTVLAEEKGALSSANLEYSKTKLELASMKAQMEQLNSTNQSSKDSFQQIIDKIEQWKSALSNTSALNQMFESQNAEISSVNQSIGALSQSSSDYSAKAASLKTDIEGMNAALRLSDGQLSTDQQSQALDAIKTKISEYGEAVTNASASAQAAYSIEQSSVQSLETEIANLQVALQGAMASGNTEAASSIQAQIESLNGTLQESKDKLSELSSESENAKSALESVSSVQEQLSDGSTRGGSFFGNIADEAQLIKEKVSESFSSMSDTVSSALEPIKTKASEVGSAVSDYLGNLSDRLGLDRVGEMFGSVGDKLTEYKNKVIDVATGNGKFQESLGNMKTALNGMPLPLGNVLTSIGGVTKALWAMCATPIGAVIAAVVLGLQAMYQWFTRSAEGQKAFTKISAYFGSIMSSLIDIVVILGKYLYHAFADAGGPLNAFVKGLKTTFVSAIRTVSELVGGLGNTLKGIFTLDWDTFKKGISQMGNGLVDAGKTVISAVETQVKGVAGVISTVYKGFNDNKLGKELGDTFGGMLGKASQAADLASRHLKVEEDISKTKVKSAQCDMKIAELRDKIYHTTGKERLELIAMVKEQNKIKYGDQIKNAKESLDIAKQTHRLHTTSLQDYEKERDMKSTLLELEARQISSNRMMSRMEASTVKHLEKQAASSNKKNSNSSKGSNDKTDAVNNAEAKLDEIILKNAASKVKMEKDIEDKSTDAKIKAMKDGSEKVSKEKKRENDKELEQISQQKESAISAEVARQKSEFDAMQNVIKAKGGKTTAWNPEEMVDKTEIEKIEKAYEKIGNDTIAAQDNESEKARLENLYEYLKSYGTVQEQKYALAKEWDDKILRAEDENQKKLLEKQKEASLASVDSKSIAMNIDWSATFNGVGNVLKDIAKDTLKEVENYMQTDDFKKLTPESKKSYTDLRSKLQSETGGDSTSPFNFKIWSTISTQVKAYQDSVKVLQEKTQAHSNAVESLKKAEEFLKNSTTDLDKSAGKASVSIWKKAVDTTGKEQKQAQTDSDNSKTNLTDSANKAANGLKNFSSYLSEMSNGSLYGFANGVTKLVTSLAKGSDGVGKSLGELGGKIGSVIGAILQILDALGDDPQKFINDLFEKITDTIEVVLSQLPEIIIDVVKDVGNLVVGIIDVLGSAFGLDIGWLSGSNAKEVNELTDKLTDSNDDLRNSIDKLKDSIDDSNGSSAITDYESAYEAQERINKQQLEILQAQMGYHGSHHSNSYYWDLSQSDYSQINKLLGTKLSSLDDFYDLTPEQLDKIRTNLIGVWADILDQGKYDKSDYWEAYADEAGKLEELTEQINENLTQVSFDSLRDSFVDTLMDMDSDASDFADDFEKYMMQALLNFAVGEKLDENLKAWYNSWAKTMQDQKGQLTKDQIASYKSQWDAFVQEGLATRDQIAALTGYSSDDSYSQSGTTGGWESVGQDSVDELNGRFASLQLSNELISQSAESMLNLFYSIISFSTANSAVLSEIRNLMITNNSFVEDITKYTRGMYKEFGSKLDDVVSNTKSLK